MPLMDHQIQMRSIMLIFGLIIAAALGFIAIMLSGSESMISPGIAVIPVSGEINLDMAAQVIKEIKDADEDITISAIILEINSPGGTVLASREIADAVKDTEKPVVAWIRETGASGAYWVASASDKIVADPASITGSIGVIGSYMQYSGLMQKYGVTYERLVSGKYKDTGSEYKELTPDERAYLQKKIDTIKEMFVIEVSQNRNLPKETVDKLATGEIFLGTEAQQSGLVDVLGGKEVAQKSAEALAGITNSRLVDKGQAVSFLDLLGAKMGSIAYNVGRGIGDSWNPLAGANQDFTLVAEMQ